jgi:ABC-type polar amino acid transport system ATPase subunit
MIDPSVLSLSAKALVRTVGDTRILDDIYLDVPRGQSVCILGRSGSGKSSLLRALALLDPLSDGFIKIEGNAFGRDMNAQGLVKHQTQAEIDQIRSRIGFVFQDFSLWPHLNVRDNISLAQRIVLRRAPLEINETTNGIMSKLSITNLADKHPGQLSGGQKQRVAVARALALSPALMLFDEPTSALDPELVGDVLALLLELKAEGMTTLTVTHEMSFARRLADRIIFLEKGRIIADGPPANIIDQSNDPRLKQFFKLI